MLVELIRIGLVVINFYYSSRLCLSNHIQYLALTNKLQVSEYLLNVGVVLIRWFLVENCVDTAYAFVELTVHSKG